MENINNYLNDLTKICKKCGIEKPIREYTHYSGSKCSNCYKQDTLERVRKSRAKNKKAKEITDTKICKKCGIEKLNREFSPSRKTCKVCFNNERMLRYEPKKINKQKNNKPDKYKQQAAKGTEGAEAYKQTLNNFNKKICKKCVMEKDVSEFLKTGKLCKICFNEYMRLRRGSDIETYNERLKLKTQGLKLCKNCNVIKEINDFTSGGRLCNNCFNEYIRFYSNQKRINNPVFKLSCNIKSSIRMSFKNAGYIKENRTQEIIGITFEQLKKYLENKFESWMNWNNHGLYNGQLNYGWDIDHIEPLFPEGIERTPEDIIRLNHYTNLQPLCSKVNRDIKRNKLDF